MQKKLYDIKNKRAGVLADAEKALNSGDMELYNSKMTEIKTFNTEIDGIENLIAEQGKFSDDNPNFINLSAAQAKAKDDKQVQSKIDNARSGNEYINAFAKALQNKVSLDNGISNESYNPLYNALSIGGGDPVGSEGGFLVPIEFDNMIHKKKKEFICLADYFNVENVSGFTGWRAVELSATRKALPLIDEGATIGKDDMPKFEKISYTVKKYGDRISISSELLNDNTAGLMRYLVDWFAPKVVLTENTLLLGLLNSLVAKSITAGNEIKDIKKALNKDLNTAHSKNAVIIANQSSYDVLDNLVDSQGRPLLVPNIADPDTYRFKNKRIVPADDDLIPNATTNAPLYIGDFKSYGTLFRRQALEFATTNIGGDSWATASSEVRGIVRMDAKEVDKASVVKKTVSIAE